MRFNTEFGWEEGDVINYIPALCAGAVARKSGLADASGWCPGDQTTFESSLVPFMLLRTYVRLEKCPNQGFQQTVREK